MRFGRNRFTYMLMLMMLVVNVKMLVHNAFVSVHVGVSLAHDDSNACEHRGCANDIWPRRKLAEHRHRCSSPDERCSGEVGRFTRGAQLTKRFDGQHNAEPIAERTDYSRRNQRGHPGK